MVNSDNYFVICPYSSDKRLGNRDFNADDWAYCRKHLRRFDAKGVVINYGKDVVPDSPDIINLSNQTNFLEAAEVLKASKGYIGIDTCWSALAPQLFQAPRLVIKSVNSQCYNERHIYFAPRKEFKFMGRSISEVVQRL